MIVPSPRLIRLSAALLLSAGLAAALWPGAVYAVLAVVLLYALFAAFDALLAPRRLAAVTVTVPEVLRLSRGREGVLPLTLQRASGRGTGAGRLAITAPDSFSNAQEVLPFHWTEGAVVQKPTWVWTAADRGVYRVPAVHLEATSPFGLWHAREEVPVSLTVKVYPDVLGERRHAPALFLNRGGAGLHPRRQVGKGREFEKLREYQPGDGYEDIHWKATARRGHPVTKLFQVERTQEVYVVIDHSRLSGRPVPGREDRLPQLEHFLASGLALGLAAERQGDHFGLITYSGKVETFVRAKTGKSHFTACREALCGIETRRVNPDFAEICSFLRVRLRKRALLVWLTNLDDPMLAESFLEQMALVRRHHLVLVNMVKGPDLQPLFSGAPPETEADLHHRLAGHIEWRDLRELQQRLRHQGVSLTLTEHARLTPSLVQQYVDVKQRQLL